ncbi:hypothetical protein KZX50_19765 [Bacillus infantis]|uniref:hypothetical protein n=1 Tax=Bacillus infantis TaxID=324767 RepID=UPI00200564A4|nr:hypothetical protein [Bacillus infantis]MCK6207683.1 hypothetical protein [Bacillus infantis]
MVKKITILLVANKLVFSGNFPQKDELIKRWEFYSSKIDKKVLEDLFTKVVVKEFGWSTCDVESTNSEDSLLLKPIFFKESLKDELTKEDQAILDKIIRNVDEFVSDYRVEKPDLRMNENSFYSDADVVVFREPGQSNSREFRSFIQKLEENNIPFYIEYEHSNAVEQGASGGLHEAIVFIGSTLASGIAYDIIKGAAFFNLLNFKKERTDILREKIADHLNTMPQNIDITHIEKKEEEIFIKVKLNRTRYEFTFSHNNKMMKFVKVETY